MRPHILAVSLAALFAILAAPFATAQSAPRPAPTRIQHVAAAPNLSSRPNASQPQVAEPVISPASGSYSGPQTVTVTDTTPGAIFYYTTDGTYPSTLSSQYNGSISISKSCTLVVLATVPGYSPAVAWAPYYITSVPDSFVYTVAGSGFQGYSGDGGLATEAVLSNPESTATDSSGNLYIADSGNNVVRRVDASTGVISTVAGTGIAGYSGDGGQATKAQLTGPSSVALDSAGNLYIGDNHSVVRLVTMSTGVITTYAGMPNAPTLGDGGPAANANLAFIEGIAIDGLNNLYVLCDECSGGPRVREVAANNQIITTVAGGGSTLPAGGPAISAYLPNPFGIAVDAAGNIYIADENDVVWKVTRSTGNITAFAGRYLISGYSGDGGPATSAGLNEPVGVAVDSIGNVFINDLFNGAIRKVDASTGVISTYAGDDNYCFSFTADGSSALSSDICLAQGLSVDALGNLYFANDSSSRVRKITAIAAPPASVTANPSFSLSPGTYADPQALTISSSTPGASIYLSVYASTQYPNPINQDSIILGSAPGYHGPLNITGPMTIVAVAVAPGHTPSNTVSAVYNVTLPPQTVISTIAGNGSYGFNPQGGGFATATTLGAPEQLAFDKNGNLYFADANQNVVWEVSATSGIATIVAGTGKLGHSGDNGPATSATLDQPFGVAVDANGNIFISDTLNNVVREVLASNGNIIPFAGNGSLNGLRGDGGPATSATVSDPEGIALDANGNVFVADSGSVREIDASTGKISTYAGGGLQSGDDISATSAFLDFPSAIAFDASGNLYIGDESGRVRAVNAKTGIITTVAGDGDLGTSGDGLPASEASVSPNGISVDSSGNVYIGSNYEIRKVDAKTGIISTIAGVGYANYSGDGGPASAATICPVLGLLFDLQSNLYFSDNCGSAVRKITFNAPAPSPTFDPPAGTYTGPQTVTIADTAPNATIYYTTDGSTPNTNSSQYNGAVAFTENGTINAIAVSSGYALSPVGSAAYTITPATPTITWATPTPITYGAALGSAQLDATANVPGTFVYSPAAGAILTAGSQTLSVTFTPQANAGYTTATATVTLTVNPATPTITWATPAPIAYGTALSATQLNATASVPGTFVYSPAAGAVLVGGSQTLSTTFTPTDATDYTMATGSVTLTVNSAIPGISLASSANPSVVGQSVTFTATLSSPAGVPTGSVTFYDGVTPLGSSTLASGVATYATAALTAGSHSITAQYSGDPNFAPITSAALTQTVITFSIGPASGAPTTASGSPGAIVNYLLSVTPPASSPVTFSVAGLPVGFVSSFTPNSVAAGAGATLVQLIINVPSQVASAAAPARPGSGSGLPYALGLILLPLLGMGRRIRANRLLLLGVLAIGSVVALAGLSGCSSHFNSGGQGNPPPPGTYSLTVTASAGAQTQTTSLTLNVQ